MLCSLSVTFSGQCWIPSIAPVWVAFAEGKANAMEGITDQSRPALARGTRLSTDKQTGEPMLLFPEGVVHLSTTAHAILEQCDGQATIGAIVATLADEFEADSAVLRDDVLECLTQLQGRKLVVIS